MRGDFTMAKGSVRKRGKKWYYRFYVENESGKLVQREFVGTESKSETEKMLRKAMEDYEEKKFIARAKDITLEDLLDIWVNEELKSGSLSNGTVMAYQGTANRIKHHPIGKRKLKNITADHLQSYMDFLTFGGENPDGTINSSLSKGYLRIFSTVLQRAFRYAVFPKRYITFNPMQYVVMRGKKENVKLFSENDREDGTVPTITHEQYLKITDYLYKKKNPMLLPIQIAYYTGLRIGEVCGLAWQDINLEEQYLTVRRSMRYNGATHKTEIDTTKRNKVRTVDFCNTLADILRKAKKDQSEKRTRHEKFYQRNYYRQTAEKGRIHYEMYSLPDNSEIPEDYKEIFLVCLRTDGTYESPNTISRMCRSVSKKIDGLEEFHFHMLRHTYTSNMLSNGAAPKEVQELLGHSDINTTMNIYAHATREAKRSSARQLDKVGKN